MLSINEAYVNQDPILTRLAQGYSMPSNRIANFVAPVVPVSTREGRVLRFGKEAFATGDYKRAYGTNIKAVQSRYDSVAYALEQETLAYELPVEVIENAGEGPAQVDLRSMEMKNLLSRLTNSYEVEVANAITTSGSYESDCYAATFSALSAAATGIDGADGIAGTIEIGRTVSDQIGQRPNSAIIGSAVYDALLTSSSILERIKYTSADSINLDIIARYFGLKRGIRVADGRTLDTTTGKLLSYFPENAIVFFYSPTAVNQSIMPDMGNNMGTPAFAYTYQLQNTPFVTPEYLVKERRVVRAEVTVERKVFLTGLGATGLIGSAFYVADALS